MSEEEKEAIETIEFLKKKRWYKYAGDDGTEILDEDEKKDVDIVLNLIDKQQKEIEEWRNGIRINDNVCVPKDKIREKIDELKKQDELSKLSHNYLIIEVLQELLEEK